MRMRVRSDGHEPGRDRVRELPPRDAGPALRQPRGEVERRREAIALEQRDDPLVEVRCAVVERQDDAAIAPLEHVVERPAPARSWRGTRAPVRTPTEGARSRPPPARPGGTGGSRRRPAAEAATSRTGASRASSPCGAPVRLSSVIPPCRRNPSRRAPRPRAGSRGSATRSPRWPGSRRLPSDAAETAVTTSAWRVTARRTNTHATRRTISTAAATPSSADGLQELVVRVDRVAVAERRGARAAERAVADAGRRRGRDRERIVPECEASFGDAGVGDRGGETGGWPPAFVGRSQPDGERHDRERRDPAHDHGRPRSLRADHPIDAATMTSTTPAAAAELERTAKNPRTPAGTIERPVATRLRSARPPSSHAAAPRNNKAPNALR